MRKNIYNVIDRDIIETMQEEAREAIIEMLEYYDDYYCDLHNEVFNTSYYRDIHPESPNAKAKARALLKNYEYEAIGRIYTYEKENFGEIYTDLSNPARVINMLFYIIGEDVLYNNEEAYDILMDNWNDRAEETINRTLIEIFNK